MKTKYYITIILVVAIIVFGNYVFLHIKLQESIDRKISTDSLFVHKALISTAYPTKRTFTLNVSWVGIVESQSSIKLRALTAGRVEAINAKDQNYIKKGKPIMRLKGSQIINTRAKLTAQMKSLETQVQLASETLVRVKENFKTRLATKEQVAIAQEMKVRLETQLRNVQLDLKTVNQQSRIASPINGIFTNRQVNVGQDVVAGQIVGDIINTDKLRIKASFYPPLGIDLQGKKASIRLNGNQIITGIVKQVLPQASSTGAVMVWIEGQQIDAELRPGQTVRGKIVVQSRSNVMAVPESAIIYDSQDHPFVFVNIKGTYKQIGIQTGVTQDGWVEVLYGLKKDQLVVVKGAYELFYRKFNEQYKVQD